MFILFGAALFIGVSLLYYFVDFGVVTFSEIFLTISSFLFAIFTGFFISRQGNRYSEIRDVITHFDGALSSIYRHSGHFGEKTQHAIGAIVKDHYEKILSHHAWDYHFVHPSTTITSIHRTLTEYCGDQKLPSQQNESLASIMTSLESLQISRKRMVALQAERIPRSQWGLVYFLGILLFITVTIIPSAGVLLNTILKASFSTSVILVIWLLHEFDRLRFFEGTMGEHSASDVLGIITGNK